jgi:hypothetical protein
VEKQDENNKKWSKEKAFLFLKLGGFRSTIFN